MIQRLWYKTPFSALKLEKNHIFLEGYFKSLF